MFTNKDILDEMLTQVNENGFDGMLEVMKQLFNLAMIAERNSVLKAKPYERTVTRIGYANGFKPKQVKTRLGSMTVAIPQVRGDVEFYPSALEKGSRMDRALVMCLCEIYVNGVSTRKVTEILQKLCGTQISSMEVSRACEKLEPTLKAWRERKLDEEYPYLYLDARYEKVRQDNVVQDAAVLIAIGVSKDGKRSVLGTSVAISEAEAHWRSFLESLVNRGLKGVNLVISDDHAGLKKARQSVLSGTAWQRCQFHLQQNALSYVTKQNIKQTVSQELRKVLTAPTMEEAQKQLQELIVKYGNQQPKLANWMEENVHESLTVLNYPQEHRKRLRTTNPLERLNRELKRRTRVASIFPNDASLLRLITAMLMEQDEQWSCSKLPYLTFND